MYDSKTIWEKMCVEAEELCKMEPEMAHVFKSHVLQHCNFSEAIIASLALQLRNSFFASKDICGVFREAIQTEPLITDSFCLDLQAYLERDAACDRLITPLIFFKGFKALQLHRMSHWLWCQGRRFLALSLQSEMSREYFVDIHPGASIGSGIMLDHATGLVIGETAVVGNNVSILHSVTLGGIGSGSGDRHPKIDSGVLIAAGVKILGNIHIGEGVKIGAGSLVLESVDPYLTVAGVPAKVVGGNRKGSPALEMDQNI